MGDHNSFDISLEELFQNGKKSWPFVVDSASDVLNKSIFWEFVGEEDGLT